MLYVTLHEGALYLTCFFMSHALTIRSSLLQMEFMSVAKDVWDAAAPAPRPEMDELPKAYTQ